MSMQTGALARLARQAPQRCDVVRVVDSRFFEDRGSSSVSGASCRLRKQDWNSEAAVKEPSEYENHFTEMIDRRMEPGTKQATDKEVVGFGWMLDDVCEL